MVAGNAEPLVVVQEWYSASTPNLLADDIDWRVLERWPNGGHYRSAQTVFEQFFPKLLIYFSHYQAVPEAYYVAGNTVLVHGFYTGTSRATGRTFSSMFVHIWVVEEGRLTSFQQVADTSAVREVL